VLWLAAPVAVALGRRRVVRALLALLALCAGWAVALVPVAAALARFDGDPLYEVAAVGLERALLPATSGVPPPASGTRRGSPPAAAVAAMLAVATACLVAAARRRADLPVALLLAPAAAGAGDVPRSGGVRLNTVRGQCWFMMP
jgi:hypothetical protein